MMEKTATTSANCSQEPTENIAVLVGDWLRERFQDEFVFDPIIVKPETDQDGDTYLHTYIIFEGDQKKLDPAWTIALSSRLWPEAAALGFPSVPVQSFVKKDEWKQ